MNRSSRMRTVRPVLMGLGLSLLAVASFAQEAPGPTPAHGDGAAPPAQAPRAASPAQRKAAQEAFLDVYRVLQSPRCMNCHPQGDAPLQTDRHVPHAMNISRRSMEAGLPCSTCHQERISEAIGVAGGPPGAPHWQLPPRETPMIFQGRTPAQLCKQLGDPVHTGGRSLAELLHHVQHDPLVLWGWSPGGNRTKPPLTHARFVAAFSTWVDGGGACPP
jgi:hypothetical protein